MKLSRGARAAALAFAAVAVSPPAHAEVIRATDNSFISRNEVVVSASPKEVWLALISPATWWRSEHTWSGDAKNLTLMPQAGGCFCETIPEVDEPGRFTLAGSAEHMRVVQAYPEQALRMVGGLGPLQSEPVTGVLTIAISKVDRGTRIVWEYAVGGAMRYEVPVIAKAVDGVMTLQLAALAKPLGIVPAPAPPPPKALPAPPASGPAERKDAPAASQGKQGPAKPAPAAAPVANPVVKPAAAPATPAKPATQTPTVADAFSDLGDKPRP